MKTKCDDLKLEMGRKRDLGDLYTSRRTRLARKGKARGKGQV